MPLVRRSFATGSKAFAVTSPIFYVNAPPHIGHAYSMVLADALARWHVIKHGPAATSSLFTGTDEHGQKVFHAAREANLSPQQWTDNVSERFRELATRLHIDVRRFIRTTERDHVVAVQEMWRRLVNNGDIYLGEHAGWYCVSEEAFYAPQHVHEVVLDGMRTMVTKEGGKRVVWVQESNYKFRLSTYRAKVIGWLRGGAVEPAERANDLVEYLEGGDEFADLSVSRRAAACKWGIPVPEDRLEEPQMIYVWLDALTNYLTVMGFPGRETTPDVHVLGKDILKFHAVYWPAFLMAAGLPLPKRLVVHGHWTIEGRKMSKSLGNSIDPLLFVNEYGPDTLRYFLLRSSRLDADADFSRDALAKVCNNDLANQLGNLIARVFNPRFLAPSFAHSGPLGAPSETIRTKVDALMTHASRGFDAYQLHVGIERSLAILQEGNRRVSEVEPWRLVARSEDASLSELRQLLFDVGHVVQMFSILMQPVMPTTSKSLLDLFAVPSYDRYAAAAPRRSVVDVSNILQLNGRLPLLFPRVMTPRQSGSPRMAAAAPPRG